MTQPPSPSDLLALLAQKAAQAALDMDTANPVYAQTVGVAGRLCRQAEIARTAASENAAAPDSYWPPGLPLPQIPGPPWDPWRGLSAAQASATREIALAGHVLHLELQVAETRSMCDPEVLDLVRGLYEDLRSGRLSTSEVAHAMTAIVTDAGGTDSPQVT